MTDQPKDEWGPWIDHDGASCPCVGMTVRVVAANGRDEIGFVTIRAAQAYTSMWIWSSIPPHWWGHRVIRYRIRKPRGMAILEQALQAQEVDA